MNLMVSGPLFGSPKGEEMSSGSNWTSLMTMNVDHPVRMAAFLNGDFGVTGGFSGRGKTHISTDRGETWVLHEDSGGCIYGVDILNADLFFVAGRIRGASFDTPGGIRSYSPAQDEWGPSTAFPFVPREVPFSFCDELNGWSSQLDFLWGTQDGGQTYQELTLPEGIGTVKSLQLMEPGKGLVLDDQGRLFYSSDNGQSWKLQAQLPEELMAYSFIRLESVSSAIRFETPRRGSMVLCLKKDDAMTTFVLDTEDGGSTWTWEAVSQGVAAVFLSPDRQYLTLANHGEIEVFHRELLQ